jgi:uncharacterized membrane protein YvbJ
LRFSRDLPYCRICGAKLEENAHFCHKCGTPAAVLTPAVSPVKAKEKNPYLVPTIVLIAVVLVAVIVGVIVFWTIYSVNFNQSNGSSQTNGKDNELSLNSHVDTAKVNFVAKNLLGKTVLVDNSHKGNTANPHLIARIIRN